MVCLRGDIDISVAIDGDLGITNAFDGELGTFQKVTKFDVYEGETNVMPSDEQQVLLTKGKMVPDNIVVQAIPSNYGLITWNGSTLTVS